jgi:hypothetical protein
MKNSTAEVSLEKRKSKYKSNDKLNTSNLYKEILDGKIL